MKELAKFRLLMIFLKLMLRSRKAGKAKPSSITRNSSISGRMQTLG